MNCTTMPKYSEQLKRGAMVRSEYIEVARFLQLQRGLLKTFPPLFSGPLTRHQQTFRH